jgi:hypothetical protein
MAFRFRNHHWLFCESLRLDFCILLVLVHCLVSCWTLAALADLHFHTISLEAPYGAYLRWLVGLRMPSDAFVGSRQALMTQKLLLGELAPRRSPNSGRRTLHFLHLAPLL